MIVRIGFNGEIEREENADITETLIALDRSQSFAMEYVPKVKGERSHVAVMIMHCDQNYMGMKMGPALAERGYHVLAAESIAGGDMDDKFRLLDGQMRYLRSDPEIDRIVLMGHSGGATLMTAYQALAENGPELYRREELIYKTRLTEKPEAADGIMLIDANYGNAVMSMISLDPAVMEEGNGVKLDPSYDLFDPANGYDPEGACYSPEFIRRYQLAQKRRNDALIAAALERLEKIERGEGNYVDDEPFFIAAADQPKPNNRMLPEDLHFLSHTKREHDLLHGDGTVTHGPIRCERTAEVDRCFSSVYGMGCNKNTVRGFLSAQALRTTEDFAVTEDGVTGVDWRSGYASPVGNIEDIAVPALMMGMTGSYEYLAAEMIYDHAKMEDKTLTFLRGATHVFTPNHAAERTPGEFGDTENALYDYMAQWLTRFV